MNPTPSKSTVLIPFIMIFLQIACWIEMDLFVPSLPQMMEHFAVSEQTIQLTLSINFLGFLVSSLFCGPMGDSFGRRPVLIGGTTLFALGGALTAFAPNIWLLLVGRFIQGVGFGAPAVLAAAVLGDLFEGERQVKWMSLMNSIVTITMAFAPILGAFVVRTYGWRANFMLIAALAVVSLALLAKWVPETLHHTKRQTFRATDLVLNYRKLLSSRAFVLPIVGLCLMITPYFVYIGIIPLLFIRDLKVPLTEYVYYQGSVVGVFALCSLLVPMLTKGANMKRLTWLSVGLSTLAAVLLGAHGMWLHDHPLTLTLLMCAMTVGMVLPCSVMFVQATETFPELRGSASALFQSIRMFSMAIGTFIAGAMYNHTYRPIGLQTAVLMVICAALLLPTLRSVTKTTEVADVAIH